MSKLKNSNIPSINLTKENMMLAKRFLTPQQLFDVWEALFEYIYNGTEPQLDNTSMGVFEQIISSAERLSKSYFNKREQMNKINANRKNKSTATQPNTITPNEEFEVKPQKTVDWERIGTTPKIIEEEKEDIVDMDAAYSEYLKSEEYQEQMKKETEYMKTHNEYDEPTADNESKLLDEWEDACYFYLTRAVRQIEDGTDSTLVLKAQNRNLQPLFEKCLDAGISDDVLLQVKSNVFSALQNQTIVN